MNAIFCFMTSSLKLSSVILWPVFASYDDRDQEKVDMVGNPAPNLSNA